MAEAKNTQKAKGLSQTDELELMDKLKTDVLFKNHKGEYFTSKNLSELSISAAEKKAGRKVATINRDTLKAK